MTVLVVICAIALSCVCVSLFSPIVLSCINDALKQIDELKKRRKGGD